MNSIRYIHTDICHGAFYKTFTIYPKSKKEFATSKKYMNGRPHADLSEKPQIYFFQKYLVYVPTFIRSETSKCQSTKAHESLSLLSWLICTSCLLANVPPSLCHPYMAFSLSRFSHTHYTCTSAEEGKLYWSLLLLG